MEEERTEPWSSAANQVNCQAFHGCYVVNGSNGELAFLGVMSTTRKRGLRKNRIARAALQERNKPSTTSTPPDLLPRDTKMLRLQGRSGDFRAQPMPKPLAFPRFLVCDFQTNAPRMNLSCVLLLSSSAAVMQLDACLAFHLPNPAVA